MKSGKIFIIVLMLMVFLLGLATFLYPYIRKSVVDSSLRNDAQEFIERVTEVLWENDIDDEATIENMPELAHADLLEAMHAYNERIYLEKQTGLCDPWSYQQPSFSLEEYGFEDEVFGAISIPKLELEMPIYLGATNENLAAGAAQLSQTSIPIGGTNTNSVIAGHRGWHGASYFRYITDLEYGDEVIITNLWGKLTYKVIDTDIIAPNQVEKVLIRPGKDMITLLTCHPYASGGKQRYLVICERTYHEPNSEINHH